MIILRRDYGLHRIRIDPAAPPRDEDVASYDLRVGAIYCEPGNAQRLTFPGAGLTLRRNSCLAIETEEELTVPDGIFGQLCSRGSLSARGLIVANTKVDPQFRGRMLVTVFNAGTKPIRLQKGECIFSVFFQLLERPSNRTQPRDPPKLETSMRPSRIRRAWDALSGNPLAVAAATAVAVVLATEPVKLAMHTLWSSDSPPSPQDRQPDRDPSPRNQPGSPNDDR